jgi:hypothetical protein
VTKIQEFDYSIDVMQAMLWQYNNAARLQSLLNQKNEWYAINQQEFWQDWYTNVFNLQTADTFGLAVWSIILDIPLFIELNPDEPGKPIWGFNEVITFPTYENDNVNFENGNFTSTNSIIVLTEEQQRLVLKLRYFQLVSRGAIPEINAFLKTLFADLGTAWVLDGLDMTIVYVFNFTVPQNLLSVFKYYDILPRPAGVKIRFVLGTIPVWGFNEVTVFPDYINNYQNFENGSFEPEWINN